MQRLGFLMLGIQLLPCPVEVIDHQQSLTQGGAGDLKAQVFAVAALALAEVVQVGSQTHVLAVEGLMLCLECRELDSQIGTLIRNLTNFVGVKSI